MGEHDVFNNCANNYNKKCINIIKTYILSTKRSYPGNQDKYKLQPTIKLVTGNYINNSNFTPNSIHNILFTIEFLKAYPNLGITVQHMNHDKYINDLYKLSITPFTKNQNSIVKIISTYIDFLYEVLPFLVIWKNKYENYITPHIGIYIRQLLKNNNINFILFKLTIIFNYSYHANIIIYDKKYNILERFEPYGFITVDSGDYDLDNFINDKIGNVISQFYNKEIEYISPKNYKQAASFQLISNDDIDNYKKIGDPTGYCLAWTYWYLEMRLNNRDVHPITLIEQSIYNILKTNVNNIKDISVDDNNKIFIDFIRNYSNKLNTIKKYIMVHQIGIQHNNIYNIIYKKEDLNKICGYFRNQLLKYTNKLSL
jgi:hypothetical protein